MGGVGSPGLPDFEPHLQIMFIDNIFEPVAANGIVPIEVPPVHIPELLPTNARVLFSDVMDVLQGKRLTGRPY